MIGHRVSELPMQCHYFQKQMVLEADQHHRMQRILPVLQQRILEELKW